MKTFVNYATLIALLLASTAILASEEIPQEIYSEDVISNFVGSEKWQFYRIDIDTPAKLTVKLRKIDNNADLYVLRSKKPSKDEFLCAPKREGQSIETCRLTANEAGTWYIGVHSKQGSHYQLGVKAKDMSLISQASLNFN